MATDVTVLRVFTDPAGGFGNPLGVVDAATVAPADRQRLAAELGYSETIFIDLPAEGAATTTARIFTPVAELPFAGHPTVGAAWWLRDRGLPVHTLQVPAGIVQISYDLGAQKRTAISARAEWSPEFAIHDVASVDELLASPGYVRHATDVWKGLLIPNTAASAMARLSCRSRHSIGSATAAMASIQTVAV